MPRKKVVDEAPVEAAPPNEDYESSSDNEEVPVEAPKQSGKGLGKGCYIDKAREKAMVVIQERKALNQKKREAEKMRQQIEKELAEAEWLKTQRDLEEVRRMKEQLKQPKQLVKASKKKQPVQESESETESEEEEVVHVKKATKKSVKKPSASAPVVSNTDVIRVAYQQRMDRLKESMLKQMFG